MPSLLKQLGRAASLAPAAALLAAVIVTLVAVIVALLGGDPSRALLAIVQGSIGTPASVTETLIKTTPLILTGLSVAVAFRCGVWNIGAEGQLLAGMLGAAAAGLYLPRFHPLASVPLCLAAGAACGALWAAIPAVLKIKRDVPEVISSIMLNFLAVYLIEYLVRGPMHEPSSANDWSPPLPDWTHLERLRTLTGIRMLGAGSVTLPDGRPILALGLEVGRLHLGVLLALAVVPLVWLWLARTGTGFRIRAVGFNPAAAETAGIPVGRTIAISFLVSGALAGLGGGIEMLGQSQRLFHHLPGDPGYGFSGIAVALLGQLHPVGVLLSALFFGALAAGCSQMQRTAGVSFHVAYVIQAVVVLFLISAPRLRARWLGRDQIRAREQPVG